jgi:hypothetical protein
MADDKYQIFMQMLPQRKVPIEFSPLFSVIMGIELGEKPGVPVKIDPVLKTKIPSVDRPAEVIVAGKGTRILKMGKKFSMYSDLLVF